MKNVGQENILERKEKPKTLYIGTQTKGIKEITPKEGNYRDKNEGAVIFSTPDKALASIFMMPNHNDSWTKIGYYGKILTVVICMDRDEYIKNDRGGSVYEVSSDSFDYNSNMGMGDKEWTSSEPVKPIGEIDYTSSLDAMIDNGVLIYFVDKKTFDEIWDADDYGKEIVFGLTLKTARGRCKWIRVYFYT
jgi:hypothetical protein